MTVPRVDGKRNATDDTGQHLRKDNERALRYYNLTGFVGWLLRFRILGRTQQSPGLVRFFDRVVLPVQLRVERVLSLPAGHSVYAVAKKR